MRIALFGGTFDPVHNGHVRLALGALEALQLDQVWWVPVSLPPHKALASDVSAEHRANMVALAIANDPAFVLSRLELDRKPPSYTIDTVEQAHVQHPGHTWFMLVGTDTAKELHTWREIEKLKTLVQFVAIPRPGEQLEGIPEWVQTIDVETLDISSSQVREKLQSGASLEGQVPERVLDYIEAEHLYGIAA